MDVNVRNNVLPPSSGRYIPSDHNLNKTVLRAIYSTKYTTKQIKSNPNKNDSGQSQGYWFNSTNLALH
jgi:hypothetical protein